MSSCFRENGWKARAEERRVTHAIDPRRGPEADEPCRGKPWPGPYSPVCLLASLARAGATKYTEFILDVVGTRFKQRNLCRHPVQSKSRIKSWIPEVVFPAAEASTYRPIPRRVAALVVEDERERKNTAPIPSFHAAQLGIYHRLSPHSKRNPKRPCQGVAVSRSAGSDPDSWARQVPPFSIRFHWHFHLCIVEFKEAAVDLLRHNSLWRILYRRPYVR